MPIIIPKDLPAYEILTNENIFVMNAERAVTQDIRPIEIAILNLMPTKVETETQLLRLLGNTPLQVNVTLLNTGSYKSKNTSEEHLERFYRSFSSVKNKHFDGMIITGAPVETLAFEDVLYWSELKEIMDFSEKMVTSTIYICWGAQAALYYHYGIKKKPLRTKMFGVFPVRRLENDPLLKGMDDVFYIPHSRHTGIDEKAVYENENLRVLAYSKKAGASVMKSKDGKKIFLTGHSEYDRYTLRNEFERDKKKGLLIKAPYNYFSDKEMRDVDMKWASAANLIFYNWINYYVYQVTPFDLEV
ncbi:MAG: homoserine O-succinyltransferase [Clostridiales bacterium]|jgi:homoserine O-succinyltransferase|nr:homoserine O-succinyltransferase [Clostridiales bacterium]